MGWGYSAMVRKVKEVVREELQPGPVRLDPLAHLLLKCIREPSAARSAASLGKC